MTQEEYRSARKQRQHKKDSERKNVLAGRGSMDIPFLLLVLLLTIIGLVMQFSASFPFAYYTTGDAFSLIKQQAFFAVLGLPAMFVTSKINYQRWRGAT